MTMRNTLRVNAVAAAVLVSILASGIAEAGGRPGARDATVSADKDRAILIQTTPMQQPGY